MKPRGIRLNNPGNIERNHIKWKGMADDQPDERFCKFISPEYGIRAMIKILMTYNSRGTNTIKKIVNTWAPEHENPTDSYVNFVCSYACMSPNEILDLNDEMDVILVIEGMVKFENGEQPYEIGVFKDAYKLAKG